MIVFAAPDWAGGGEKQPIWMTMDWAGVTMVSGAEIGGIAVIIEHWAASDGVIQTPGAGLVTTYVTVIVKPQS